MELDMSKFLVCGLPLHKHSLPQIRIKGTGDMGGYYSKNDTALVTHYGMFQNFHR